MGELELERNCFNSVQNKQWEKAKKYCTELIIVDDEHHGGWAQLCIAEYHIGNNQNAYQYCRYAVLKGTQNPRVFITISEIELENAFSKKSGK
ncbi:hypothetical protein HZB05_00830 [Candidatus Wolfebacteria bacterium]|nr:hypothetical protein [Candidatus Wolfebacteria bacterium]